MDDVKAKEVREIVAKAADEITRLATSLKHSGMQTPEILDQLSRQIAGQAALLKANVGNALTPTDDSWKDLARHNLGTIGRADEDDDRFEQGEKRERWNYVSTVGGRAKAVTIFTHGNGPITEAEADTAFKSWEEEGGTNTGAHTARNVTVEVIWEYIDGGPIA